MVACLTLQYSSQQRAVKVRWGHSIMAGTPLRRGHRRKPRPSFCQSADWWEGYDFSVQGPHSPPRGLLSGSQCSPSCFPWRGGRGQENTVGYGAYKEVYSCFKLDHKKGNLPHTYSCGRASPLLQDIFEWLHTLFVLGERPNYVDDCTLILSRQKPQQANISLMETKLNIEHILMNCTISKLFSAFALRNASYIRGRYTSLRGSK